MAPDAASVAAARKLAQPGAWQNLGESERAFWGQCQGSALYRTQVAALDYATKCTCPSRKFPCKHALGLLLLIAEAPQTFARAPEPEWVATVIDKRSEARQKKEMHAGIAKKPVDLEARAKRVEKRQEKVLAGVEQLEVWLGDIVRRGLARLPSEGYSFWDAQARRLVDAQAPGLASRVRAIGARVGVGEDWAERVLGELGRLALLLRAYRRLDALPSALAHDVRRLVGFTLDQSEVVAQGDNVEDVWVVASSSFDEEEHLRTQRSWLVGEATGRTALVLQFAAGTARFSDVLLPGLALRARVAFWPSARPERALIVERTSAPEPGHAPGHASSIAAALDAHARALSKDPWLGRMLFVLAAVRVVPGDVWHVADDAGDALPLRGREHDVLWALSGGHALLLVGEWDGYELEPLAVHGEGRVVSLAAASDEERAA